MVCSAMGAGVRDALTAGHTGLQAKGQHVQRADQQLPEGRADKAAADAHDGKAVGDVYEVDFHLWPGNVLRCFAVEGVGAQCPQRGTERCSSQRSTT